MTSPAVTVLMPVYNGAPYVSTAIESILSQTFQDFELLILDDGSVDATPAILARYAALDGRIRVVGHMNQGVTRTLNRGIELAKAPLIARQDADDISLPERLAKQVSFLMQHPQCVLVGSSIRIIKKDSPEIILPLPTEHAQLVELMRVANPIAHGSVIFRRQAMLAIGGYPDTPGTHYIEDLAAWLELAGTGLLANLPEVLYVYRSHDASISSLRKAQQEENRLRLLLSMPAVKRRNTGTGAQLCAALTSVWGPRRKETLTFERQAVLADLYAQRARTLLEAREWTSALPRGVLALLFKYSAVRRKLWHLLRKGVGR